MVQPLHVKKTGIPRLVFALSYSWAGLRSGWSEPAFRQEALAALVLLPLACWLGSTWVERALLMGTVLTNLLPAGHAPSLQRGGTGRGVESSGSPSPPERGRARQGPGGEAPVRTVSTNRTSRPVASAEAAPSPIKLTRPTPLACSAPYVGLILLQEQRLAKSRAFPRVR